MNLIVLLGKEDNEFDNLIVSCLNKYGGYIDFQKEKTLNKTKVPNFLLYKTETFPGVGSIEKFLDSKDDTQPFSILIFKNKFSIDKSAIKYLDKFIPIVSSDNKEALTLLKDISKPAISCGSSSRNTISIASSSDNNVVLSLQRCLKTVNLKILEPKDYVIHTKFSNNFYPIMAALSALIISGIDLKTFTI